MLPPRVEARILQELHIQPHESVLEIGAGSGYMTALAAHRAQTVHAIEIDPRLRDFAAANLARNGVINAHVELGDGAQGWAAGAPYDVIIVSASMPVIPDAMRAQLRIGGRLAAFVGRAPAMQAEIVTRTGESAWSTRTLFETVVPALRNAQSPSTFRF
jgi:protein-L-isoaspartate(D-aspartate) O-methyltransferase